MQDDRKGKADNVTPEADIKVTLNLDRLNPDKPGYHVSISAERQEVNVDLSLLEHMLLQFFRFAEWGAEVCAKGDYAHHVAEEAGKGIGQAIKEALGDRTGIQRLASITLPMEGMSATCNIDISGRGNAVIDLQVMHNQELASLAKHLLTGIAVQAGIDLQCKVVIEDPLGILNDHHALEAVGKAFGEDLRNAIKITRTTIPSTQEVTAS